MDKDTKLPSKKRKVSENTGSETETVKTDAFLVNVCWGFFDSHGDWQPSKNLAMSAEEQYQQNLKAGFITRGAKKAKELS